MSKKILNAIENILGILIGGLTSYLWTIYEYAFAAKVIDLWSIGIVKIIVVVVNIVVGMLLGLYVVNKIRK